MSKVTLPIVAVVVDAYTKDCVPDTPIRTAEKDSAGRWWLRRADWEMEIVDPLQKMWCELQIGWATTLKQHGSEK